jgi:CubicO group peptidase (beta-lactamase class C family)
MKIRIQTIAALFVLGVIGLIAAIGGLWVFVLATTKPLHPDPQKVPSVAHSAPPPQWANAVEQGREIARVGLLDQNLPGLSVAIGAGGHIVWAEGFGLADLDGQRRVTPDTRFRTGEVSKALTSAAVGLLLEQNKLKLDDEIQTYVPEFPKKQWAVTLRQLMGQVAGLRDDAGDEAWLEPCERTLDGLKLFAEDKLLFEPGTEYRASSYSWILVSAAVEAAAGQRFFRFMRSQIFEPLGMAATRPDAAKESIADRATFYFPRFAGDTRYGPQSARQGDHSCYAGASAFLSTPSDLVRFGTAISSHFRQGSGAQGGKLLQPGTVALLQTPGRLPSGEETGYGLGWRIETLPLGGQPARMAGHGTKADFIGGSTYLMTFPERGIVVAVMSNTAFADARSIALKIAEVFAAQGKSSAAK